MSWKDRKRAEQYRRDAESYYATDPAVREAWDSELCASCGARRDHHDALDGPCPESNCSGFVVRKPEHREDW